MESVHGFRTDQSQLLGVVHGVRNRYRAKRALLGAAITVGGGWAVLALASYAMQLAKYSGGVVLTARIASVLAIVALVYWAIVRPLRPRLDDERVALYLEEHERSLHASLITAVELQTAPAGNVPRSPIFIERLTRAALDRVHKAGDGRGIDAGELRTNAMVFAAVTAVTILFTVFGPASLRHGMRLIADPFNVGGGPVSLFSIAVEPGNTTVARGGDELISAQLNGFQSERVELLVRSADSANWTRVQMLPDSTGAYAARLFDISNATQYIVEATGVRSGTFTIGVSNLPYVRTMNLQYRYPAYTQLDPLDVDSTGDIAAVKGTMVRVRVTPTVPTTSGRVIVDGGGDASSSSPPVMAS